MNPSLEYIERCPEPYRAILMHVQVVIENVIPNVQLKYKWGMPFYYLDHKTMFCFLNFRKSFIDLGLVNGVQLSDPHSVLIAGENRKLLRSLRYEKVEDVDDKVLIETLEELLKIRQEMKRNVT